MLHARRALLVARSDLQREEIARETEGLRNYLVAADFVAGAVAYVRGRSPELPSASAIPALPLVGLRWVLRAHRAWRTVRDLFGSPF